MIKAAQYLFANVEPDASPAKRGGYQSVAWTHADLGPDDVAALEERMVHYGGERAPTKRVYFPMSEGRVAIGQLHMTAELDSAGRRGRYIGHVLVLARGEFESEGADPWRVFEGFSFCKATDEALALCNGDDLEQATVVLAAPRLPDGGPWSSDARIGLCLCALRADEVLARDAALAVVGRAEQVEDALRVAWAGVPTSLRWRCSFDTGFEGCNFAATPYWAVGLEQRPTSPRYVVADAATGEWTAASVPRTAFERWVAAVSADATTLTEQRETVWQFVKWLESRAAEPWNGRDPSDAAMEWLRQSCPDLLAGAAVRSVKAEWGEAIAKRVGPAFAAHYSGADLLLCFRSGAPGEDILRNLFGRYRSEGFVMPGWDERTAVDALLSRSPLPEMQLLSGMWSRNSRPWEECGAAVGADVYHELCRASFKRTEYDRWLPLVAGCGKAYVDVLREQGTPSLFDYERICERLTAVGAEDQIARVPRPPAPVAPPAPRQVVPPPAAAPEPPKGMWSRIVAWLTGRDWQGDR